MTGSTGGGAYYMTAVQLRDLAKLARAEKQSTIRPGPVVEAALYEVAAALCCVAQAIEDTAQPTEGAR